MPLKRPLRLREIGARRLAVGVIAGVVFAMSFHLAAVGAAQVGLVAILGDPVASAENIRHSNAWFDGDESGPFPVPEIVAEPIVQVPTWIEPFWSGLSAAFGQALMLSVWFIRPRRRRTMRHARRGAETGRMWVGFIPMVLLWVWFIYAVFVTRANYWATAYGAPHVPDLLVPFVPFGAASALLVLIVALEPWRGVQREVRCGWIPAVSVSVTLAAGAVLFGLSRWLFPGVP